MSSGKHDYEFMDYSIRVLQRCKAYGFKVYLDPHQDVVSCTFAAVHSDHLA